MLETFGYKTLALSVDEMRVVQIALGDRQRELLCMIDNVSARAAEEGDPGRSEGLLLALRLNLKGVDAVLEKVRA